MSTNPSYPPILSSLLPNLLTHPSYPSSYEHLPLLPIPSTQPFYPSILTNFSYLSLLPTLLHIFPMSTYPSYPPILPSLLPNLLRHPFYIPFPQKTNLFYPLFQHFSYPLITPPTHTFYLFFLPTLLHTFPTQPSYPPSHPAFISSTNYPPS